MYETLTDFTALSRGVEVLPPRLMEATVGRPELDAWSATYSSPETLAHSQIDALLLMSVVLTYQRRIQT